MGRTSDCSCCSRSSSLRGGGSEDSAQLRSSWLWVDPSQANPRAKTGTLLIDRQQEVNLKEAHKDDQCLKIVSAVFWWTVGVLLIYASFLWAVPALLKDKRWFEGPLRCIPPQARRAVSGKPAGCYSAAGGKNPIQLLSAGGKLKLNFHLASVPSLSCYHVNRNNLVLSHSAFTWHNDEQYTASTKISLLEFNHGWRGKDGICDKESAQVPNWTTVM